MVHCCPWWGLEALWRKGTCPLLHQCLHPIPLTTSWQSSVSRNWHSFSSPSQVRRCAVLSSVHSNMVLHKMADLDRFFILFLFYNALNYIHLSNPWISRWLYFMLMSGISSIVSACNNHIHDTTVPQARAPMAPPHSYPGQCRGSWWPSSTASWWRTKGEPGRCEPHAPWVKGLSLSSSSSTRTTSSSQPTCGQQCGLEGVSSSALVSKHWV